MTAIAGLQIIADPDRRPHTLAFRGPDGEKLCAACGCPEIAGPMGPGHCLQCGCLTRKGDDDECMCARFVPEISICPECGHLFRAHWQLQVHMLPTPRCRISARAAFGFDPVTFEPPLKNQTAQRIADKTRRT
jgi:hypothetical protein